MRVLSLFTGGGLGDYGLELAGMETVGQVERDEYCQKVLALRWPNVPKWRDIHDVTEEAVRQRCGHVDLVAGGFPCQPFSVAGKQKAKQDDRYLWPEMFRVISEVKPAWVIAENVPGIIGFALDDVLHDLEAEGYATGTVVFPAHALGAPHRRDRVWVVGYSESNRVEGRTAKSSEQGEGETLRGPERAGETISNSDDSRCRASTSSVVGNWTQSIEARDDSQPGTGGRCKATPDTRQQPTGSATEPEWTSSNTPGLRRQWETEPSVGRVVDGSANRLDRLKLLGNGQVVQAAQFIAEGIMNYAE